MDKRVPIEGSPLPSRSPTPGPAAGATSGPSPLERLASFRFTYVAICAFIGLYLFSVKGLERALDDHFQERVFAAANRADPAAGRLAAQVRREVDAVLNESPWTRLGGVRVTAVVLGADGGTLLYTGSHPLPEPPGPATDQRQLLPPLVDVAATVPHNAFASNAILVSYAAMLLTTLFLYTRTLTRREAQRLEAARNARDRLARRAGEIEAELEKVRERLGHVAPREQAHTAEIRSLQSERAALVAKLDEVERREAALRTDAGQNEDLEREHHALEELLEEALGDLDQKDGEIQTLQKQIRKQDRSSGRAGRQSEQLARRLRTLYKNLEIDERAIQDLVGLREEAQQLKAEEQLKRLSEETDNASVRRKIGGLPPHLSVFELSFGGKGRIYYCRGSKRRYRVLLVGAKNSQKPDLEYLSRLPKE